MPANRIPARSTLLVVDVQCGMDSDAWGERNNPQAEKNIAELLAAWRAAGWPVLHVQHLSTSPDSPLHPDKPGVAIKPEAAPLPDEPVIQKRVNSAFIGTDLEARLRQSNAPALVIVGMTTNHCVSTTTRMAGNLGFDTYLVADATAAFPATGFDGTVYPAQQVHDVALANLNEEFATILTSQQLLGQLESATAA